MRSRILIGLLALALSAQVSAALLENVPLQWRPTSDLQLGTVQMTQSSIQFEVFQDARENKQAIGENQESDKPKPVTTRDDVGVFVSNHMRELFQRAGLKTVDSDGAVTIKGEVKPIAEAVASGTLPIAITNTPLLTNINSERASCTSGRRVAISRRPYCGRNTISMTMRCPVKRAQVISMTG